MLHLLAFLLVFFVLVVLGGITIWLTIALFAVLLLPFQLFLRSSRLIRICGLMLAGSLGIYLSQPMTLTQSLTIVGALVLIFFLTDPPRRHADAVD